MLTTNPQDSLFSCFTGHLSGINITTVINKKVVIWACTRINDWCFIQCLLCRVRCSGRHSLELHPPECFGQMWSCLTMSHSPGDGAEAAPGWQAAPAELGIAFPAELQGRWAATGKVGAEGAQRRALAHQLLLLDDGGHRVLLKTTTVPNIPSLAPTPTAAWAAACGHQEAKWRQSWWQEHLGPTLAVAALGLSEANTDGRTSTTCRAKGSSKGV